MKLPQFSLNSNNLLRARKSRPTLLWRVEKASGVRNLILRVFISATRATAKTLTQTGHVAPRFWVPRGTAKRGRGGKGSFVCKRVNYELSVKSGHNAFRVGTVRK